ncbi:hypothetical protein BC628DRAFT_1414636 [Trametes gibbosa]|nr:hypothetical protein BC628DRAFT_1414636 [Trametes gibbosa]
MAAERTAGFRRAPVSGRGRSEAREEGAEAGTGAGAGRAHTAQAYKPHRPPHVRKPSRSRTLGVSSDNLHSQSHQPSGSPLSFLSVLFPLPLPLPTVLDPTEWLSQPPVRKRSPRHIASTRLSAAPPFCPNAQKSVDEDTLLKLRNVGSRVRKSVTEGFQRTVSVPADPSVLTKRLPFTQTPSFISANDAMRDIFAAARAAKNKGTSSAPSSPQQRPKRTHGPDENDPELEDADIDADDLTLDEDENDTAPTTAAAVRAARENAARLKEEKHKREIRPLKRSASRPGGIAIQSLPASMFRFSHEPANASSALAVAGIAEEDWSEGLGVSGTAGLSADLEI